MRPAEEIARLVRENYSDEALDLLFGNEERSVTADASGFVALGLPRAERGEPFRSFHLIDSRAVADVVVTTFSWGDVPASEMTYVMPLDVGRLALEATDERAFDNVLTRYIEWTLGGPRESWEADRAWATGPSLTVVRPWPQDG